MPKLLDLVLSTEAGKRTRLSQALLAVALMATGVLVMNAYARFGIAPARPVWIWSAVSLGGLLVIFALIRSGWSHRLEDASMTVPQMVFSIGSGAAAYALAGAGRGGVFPIVMVVLVFGVFVASPAQMRAISAYAVAIFGAAMAWMSWRQPAVYPPLVELGHFVMVATMVPATAVLAGRLSRLRHRARQHSSELKEALNRIRELATRDELTGLINRRHMHELVEQEHQRCTRSGLTFCVAMLDLDHFKQINDNHGHAAGDDMLRAVAQEAQRHVRAADVLARWGGEEFVLMMPEARAALARGGLERLRERIGALQILHRGNRLGITLSAGLAEHHAGETVAQTLERADRALYEAKAQGRNRVVVAV
ncbi:MAG: diguanylate cyclase [Rubrivivax sp.]|nr:diguanylate cyclase [Rubrivivax sp.]